VDIVEHPGAEHKMRFACWLYKAINKQWEYVEHTAFFTSTVVTQPHNNITAIRTL
jgi:hypothetical protein